jgi:hypothetical protein
MMCNWFTLFFFFNTNVKVLVEASIVNKKITVFKDLRLTCSSNQRIVFSIIYSSITFFYEKKEPHNTTCAMYY